MMRGDVRLYHGDCLKLLLRLGKASIDAVVTSPPYAMQRAATYGGIPENEYPAWIVRVFDATRNALADRGSIFLVIREHRKGPGGMSDYVHRSRLALRADGWIEVDEMPWIKPNAPPCGPNFLPRNSWERILWFAKTSAPRCDPLDRSKTCKRAVNKSIMSWKERCGWKPTGSLTKPAHPRRPNFIVAAVGQDREPVNHPARFPLELARSLVRLSGQGARILDPFMGSGTTGLAAVELGYRFVGCEIDAGYYAIARQRIHAAAQKARRAA